MNELAKILIFVGALVMGVGILLAVFPPQDMADPPSSVAGGKIPGFGRLPGDILIKRENFTFYFPITTCILISIVIGIILALFRR